MNDDFCLRVAHRDIVDPLQDILAVEPAHAHIAAFAFTAGAQIRCNDLVASLIVRFCQAQRPGVVSAVAVQHNGPAVAVCVRMGVADTVQR